LYPISRRNARGALAALCGGSWIIGSLVRRPSGGSHVDAGRVASKFLDALEQPSGEAHVFVFFLCCSFSGHGGLAGEDQLRDVGEGDGVTTGDALARKLPDKFAEEEIHFIGGGEAVDVIKELGGEHLRIHHGLSRLETAGVVGAERRAGGAICWAMIGGNEHVATAAAGALVLALLIGLLFWGHRVAFLDWK